MLRIKGSAEHSRWTCVYRPSCSVDEKLHNNAPHRKMPLETTTACVSLLVFFIIRRGIFPYSVEDDASTICQTPTTHCTNTCVKLTIVTHLSFSERIAVANLSFSFYLYHPKNRILHDLEISVNNNKRISTVLSCSIFHIGTWLGSVPQGLIFNSGC